MEAGIFGNHLKPDSKESMQYNSSPTSHFLQSTCGRAHTLLLAQTLCPLPACSETAEIL